MHRFSIVLFPEACDERKLGKDGTAFTFLFLSSLLGNCVSSLFLVARLF